MATPAANPATHSDSGAAPPALSAQQQADLVVLAEHLIASLREMPVGTRSGVASVEVHCDEGRPVRITGHMGNGRR